mmetsp:Transcript_33758/g.81799  ORF Transcript_33758/g.81799 Transcript_33758/m.81799 type:complete len:233 (-) Transcript_33758:555-1253(-)
MSHNLIHNKNHITSNCLIGKFKLDFVFKKQKTNLNFEVNFEKRTDPYITVGHHFGIVQGKFENSTKIFQIWSGESELLFATGFREIKGIIGPLLIMTDMVTSYFDSDFRRATKANAEDSTQINKWIASLPSSDEPNHILPLRQLLALFSINKRTHEKNLNSLNLNNTWNNGITKFFKDNTIKHNCRNDMIVDDIINATKINEIEDLSEINLRNHIKRSSSMKNKFIRYFDNR